MPGPASRMKLWLDDIRPAPPGWTHVRSVPEAQRFLLAGVVEEASFDHDLGAGCERGCWTTGDVVEQACARPCDCPCHLTGYDLCKWMAETGHWPTARPRIHSANVVGRENIRLTIERYGPYGR